MSIHDMATINLRIDDELKARAFEELKKLGVTPSELLRQTLQYVADSGELPFKNVLLTDEDAELLAIARERLREPQRGKVPLDEL